MKIKSVLESHFGITDAIISTLEGYDSISYKVKSKKRVFVLKQNAYSKETLALLKAENQIFESLKTLREYDFPTAILSTRNESIVVLEDQIFRLLSFVEGDFLGDITHTPTLLNSFGVFLAKMDKRIHNEYHDAIIAKETQWDLKHFKLNYTYLGYITNSKDRSLVDYFFLQFDAHISPIAHELRKGIIHNDGNDWNVLTKNGKVSGIIDFGDMCHSWVINELAIAITYVMMDKENPLKVASDVLKGYHSVFPLKNQELDLLYYLVAARLCTSVCNSAYAKNLKPDSEYITVSEKPAWRLLRKWVSIKPIQVKDVFREASVLSKNKKSSTTTT